ncbi:hypothetical protein Droror1_Dr00027743 [Drosera rotundifolia]
MASDQPLKEVVEKIKEAKGKTPRKTLATKAPVVKSKLLQYKSTTKPPSQARRKLVLQESEKAKEATSNILGPQMMETIAEEKTTQSLRDSTTLDTSTDDLALSTTQE